MPFNSIGSLSSTRAQRLRPQTDRPSSTSDERDLYDDDIAFDAMQRERTRLADALHDGALQEVFALRRDCRRVTCEGDARHDLDDGLGRVMTELRTLTGALHEPSLDEVSLRTAVGRIVAAVRIRNRIVITVDVAPGADGYNAPVVRETVRELTTNIAQHADASIATIAIALEGDDLVLRVADDGSGVNPAKAESARAAGHIGLTRLRRSADRLGGSFDLRPAIPAGTVATVRFPAAVVAFEDGPTGG